MNTMLTRVAASLLACVGSVSPAVAATITYTASANAIGTRDGNAFENPVTFIGVGDTSFATSPRAGLTVIPLSSLVAQIGAITYTVQSNTEFFSNAQDTFAGFSFTGGLSFVAAFIAPEFADYDGKTSVSVSNASGAGAPFEFATNGGRFVLEDLTDVGFSATGAAPAVPEPETWLLMIVGFGLVGYAMRRRAVYPSSGGQVAWQTWRSDCSDRHR